MGIFVGVRIIRVWARASRPSDDRPSSGLCCRVLRWAEAAGLEAAFSQPERAGFSQEFPADGRQAVAVLALWPGWKRRERSGESAFSLPEPGLEREPAPARVDAAQPWAGAL